MLTKRIWIAVTIISLIYVGCTQTHAKLHLADRTVNLKKYIAQNPLKPEENIRADIIAVGSQTSVHLVQIRTQEKPHMHNTHDLRVVIIDGSGWIVINERKAPVKAGDVLEIPRKTPHYFINGGRKPAGALVTFSPPFKGKDIVPVK